MPTQNGGAVGRHDAAFVVETGGIRCSVAGHRGMPTLDAPLGIRGDGQALSEGAGGGCNFDGGLSGQGGDGQA